MREKSLIITTVLLFVNAAFSLIVAAASLVIMQLTPVVVAVVTILLVGNALAFLLSAILVWKNLPIGYILAAIVLSVNIILTITDQFGLADLLNTLFDVVILGFLFLAWRNRHV
jgi:hypothetical protein